MERESLPVEFLLPSKMKLTFVFALLVIVVEGTVELKYLRRLTAPCDINRDARQIPGKRYVLHSESVTWFQAKERCESNGGILASPTSCWDKADLRALVANRSHNLYMNVTNELHGGFFRPDYFISVFGIPLYETGYQRWAPQQENPQVCGTYNHNLLLYDAKCLDKRSFVCEYSTRAQEKQVNLTQATLVAEIRRARFLPLYNRITPLTKVWNPLMQQGRMHWYSFEKQAQRWWIAMNECRKNGGHLLTLNHQAEANAIKEFILQQQTTDYQSTELTFVGFHNGNNLFVNLQGDFMRDGWESEQPDDETCLAINRDALLQKVPCWHELNYICELTLLGQNDF